LTAEPLPPGGPPGLEVELLDEGGPFEETAEEEAEEEERE